MSSLLLSPRRWTLRARLIGVVVALLAVVCILVGGAVTLSLRGFLYGKLDAQVTAVTSRALGGYDGDDRPRTAPGYGSGPQLGFLNAPGLPFGTVGAHIRGGAVDDAGILKPDQTQPITGRLTNTKMSIAMPYTQLRMMPGR